MFFLYLLKMFLLVWMPCPLTWRRVKGWRQTPAAAAATPCSLWALRYRACKLASSMLGGREGWGGMLLPFLAKKYVKTDVVRWYDVGVVVRCLFVCLFICVLFTEVLDVWISPTQCLQCRGIALYRDILPPSDIFFAAPLHVKSISCVTKLKWLIYLIFVFCLCCAGWWGCILWLEAHQRPGEWQVDWYIVQACILYCIYYWVKEREKKLCKKKKKKKKNQKQKKPKKNNYIFSANYQEEGDGGDYIFPPARKHTVAIRPWEYLATSHTCMHARTHTPHMCSKLRA